MDKKFSKQLYRTKVSEIGKYFYVLMKKDKGKILGDDKKDLIKIAEYVPEKVYRKCTKNCKCIRDKYEQGF